MAFKREKILAAAQKAVRKGNYDRAIKEYQQLVQADPKNKRIRLKMADIFVKLSKLDDALKEYKIVAQQYAGDDFFEKAAAVYKQALRISPEDPQLHQELGQAYYQYGRLKDAVRAYSKAERIYKNAEQFSAHQRVLEKMVEMDPENVGIQIQLAERFEKNGVHDQAIVFFQKAANQLKMEGRTDEYVQVTERLIFLEPDKLDARKEIIHIYLDRNDNRRALRHLQVCFKKLPDDIETLELLGSTFNRLEDKQKSILVYKQLVTACKKSGDEHRLKDVYRTILRISPNDKEAMRALGTEKSKIASAPKSPLMVSETIGNEDSLAGVMFLDDDDDDIDPFEADAEVPTQQTSVQKTKADDFFSFAEDAMKGFDDFDLGEIDEIPTFKLDSQPKAVVNFLDAESEPEEISHEKLVPIHLSVEDAERVQQFQSEAEVFLKYRLLDQAIEVLNKTLALDPSNDVVREQLADAFFAQKKYAESTKIFIDLAKEANEKNNITKKDRYLARAKEVSQDSNLLQSLIEAYQLGPETVLENRFNEKAKAKTRAGLDDFSSSLFDFELDQDPAVTGSNDIGEAFSSEIVEIIDDEIELELEDLEIEDANIIDLDDAFDGIDDGVFDLLFEDSETNPKLKPISKQDSILNPFAGTESLTSAFRSISATQESSVAIEASNMHIELGLTYAQMEMHEDAIEEYKQALNEPHMAPIATMHIALSQIELGDTQGAKEKLQGLLSDPKAPADIRKSARECLAKI